MIDCLVAARTDAAVGSAAGCDGVGADGEGGGDALGRIHRHHTRSGAGTACTPTTPAGKGRSGRLGCGQGDVGAGVEGGARATATCRAGDGR